MRHMCGLTAPRWCFVSLQQDQADLRQRGGEGYLAEGVL